MVITNSQICIGPVFDCELNANQGLEVKIGVSSQKELKLGSRVWVKVPRLDIERKYGTITAIKRNRYSVEWDIETEEGHSEYSAHEITNDPSGRERHNGHNGTNGHNGHNLHE